MAIDKTHMTMTLTDVSENQEEERNPVTTNPNVTQQQHQNPNLIHQNQQHNPKSPKTLEAADPEHPPDSDPDGRIEADPKADDDVEMIGTDPDSKPDLRQEEERENFGEEGLGKEVVSVIENDVDFEDDRLEEENGRLCFDGKNFVSESELLFSRGNGIGGDDVESMEFEEQKLSQESEEGEEEGGGECEEEEDGEEGEEEEEEEEEEDEEEEGEEEEEREFDLPMGGETSTNIFQGIEAMQAPFSSFFPSMVETNTIQVNSSQFGHDNNEILHRNKRTGQDNNELCNSNKRMRTGESDFDMCMEQMQHWMGKVRTMYVEKEQACAELSMNQQLLLNELHKREAENQQLQATIQCLQQKRQSEVYRYERELHLMTDLLNGYRKSLRETRQAFAEYRERAPCAQLDGPLYKDVSGGGGLVLSVKELEKQRLEEEQEERMNRLLAEKIIKDFEAKCVAKFAAHRCAVESLNNRLLDVENQMEPFRELIAKRKVSKS